MQKVQDLRSAWDQEQAVTKAAAEKRSKKNKEAPDAEDIFVEDAGQEAAPSTANLFEDSDSDSDDENENEKKDDGAPESSTEKKSESEDNAETDKPEAPVPTHEDLFGDSSEDESDEELAPSSAAKRSNDDNVEHQPVKKRKVVEE